MPWKECSTMDERLKFIARLLEDEKMAPLHREFGISRVTGYKIFERYKECGLDGLNDRSRRPYRQANRREIVGALHHPGNRTICASRSHPILHLTRLKLPEPNLIFSEYRAALLSRERSDWLSPISRFAVTIGSNLIFHQATHCLLTTPGKTSKQQSWQDDARCN